MGSVGFFSCVLSTQLPVCKVCPFAWILTTIETSFLTQLVIIAGAEDTPGFPLFHSLSQLFGTLNLREGDLTVAIYNTDFAGNFFLLLNNIGGGKSTKGCT